MRSHSTVSKAKETPVRMVMTFNILTGMLNALYMLIINDY